MDTLKVVSAPTAQGSELVRAPPKKDGESGGAVSALATAAPAKLPEPGDQENKQQIANAVKDINNAFQMERRSLAFSIDKASGEMVVQIRDTETNKLIRQIPEEDVLKLAKRLGDLTGVLFKAQA